MADFSRQIRELSELFEGYYPPAAASMARMLISRIPSADLAEFAEAVRAVAWKERERELLEKILAKQE